MHNEKLYQPGHVENRMKITYEIQEKYPENMWEKLHHSIGIPRGRPRRIETYTKDCKQCAISIKKNKKTQKRKQL